MTEYRSRGGGFAVPLDSASSNGGVIVNAAMVTDLFEKLSEESQIAAASYIQYLMYMEGQRKAERARRAFEAVDAMLDGDTGWASEEEMIADVAEFRRKRMAENENTH